MSRILIIGAGGVGQVVAAKCAQVPEFKEIMLASRTKSKCDAIAQMVKKQTGRTLQTAVVDADNVAQTVALMKCFQPDILINVALPYQDLTLMEACLEYGCHYVDTANYEPKDCAKFEYKWQWAYQEKFKKAGLFALLGSGFDPGVTNVFTAYALKHHFDEIETLDIIDCNAGDHGLPFATNFNPEINLREVSANGRFFQNNQWMETKPLELGMHFKFPEGIGEKKLYCLYHEELESLVKHIPTIKRARFWMTFSDNYLMHMKVLQNVGLLRIDKVAHQGVEIIPIEFLRTLLPDPASLGPLTKGKTCIGCLVKGKKDSKAKTYWIYNTCIHENCFQEVGSQAISYTTGVPAMVGALMIAKGEWKGAGVFNIEQLNPDPFLADLSHYGLPFIEEILDADFELNVVSK